MATEIIRNSRVWDVLLPGSHDSGTYECTHTPKGVAQRGLMEFIKSFVQTQDKTIYEQLLSGVRFLDLRVCIDPLDGTRIPYIAHGGYRCVNFVDALLDIRKFLRNNPTEVVFLSCKPDAGFKTGEFHMSLGVCDFWVSAILWQVMGDKLRSNTTIAELVEKRQQLVYFYAEVERFCPQHPLKSSVHRLASQCSIKLQTLDSVLGSPAFIRNVTPVPVDSGGAKQRAKIIRYDSTEYYSRHKLTAKHRNLNFDGSDWDLFTGVLKANIVSANEGETKTWTEEWEYDPDGDSFWQLDQVKFSRDYAFKFRCGELHAATPLNKRSLDDNRSAEWNAAMSLQSSRFPRAVRDHPGSFRLRPQDAVRYKQMGLSRMFFECPLRVKLSPDFLFTSYLRTGRTILTKSWGQTCENNPKYLVQKLKYWTTIHGRDVPRQPYRLRLIAGEVTPPSPDFPQPGSELMKFWAQQSASALFFLPTGTRPNALTCNKILLSDFLVPSTVSRVNGITHDFVSRKLVLTMLFHHTKFLRQYYRDRLNASTALPAPVIKNSDTEATTEKEAGGSQEEGEEISADDDDALIEEPTNM